VHGLGRTQRCARGPQDAGCNQAIRYVTLLLVVVILACNQVCMMFQITVRAALPYSAAARFWKYLHRHCECAGAWLCRALTSDIIECSSADNYAYSESHSSVNCCYCCCCANYVSRQRHGHNPRRLRHRRWTQHLPRYAFTHNISLYAPALHVTATSVFMASSRRTLFCTLVINCIALELLLSSILIAFAT
jgi:hypothetical protein